MTAFINEFENRVKEVDLYFKFIERILTHKTQLYFSDNKKKKSINLELTKILRANGFLLLYNLVESSIKNSIQEIYNSLNAENTSYANLSEALKKKWIELNYKNFKPDIYVAEKIFHCITNMEFDIINMPLVNEKFAGNIDSRKVREYSATYGFSSKTHYTTKNGEKLFIVKNKRNDLAHGIISFSDCGKDYTIEELLEIKKQVIGYLRGILKNIDSYISNKEFLQVA